LVLIYINDIDSGIVNRLFKFADDTKLVGTVYSEQEIEQFRLDIKRLYDWSWSVDWQMRFNTDKCRVRVAATCFLRSDMCGLVRGSCQSLCLKCRCRRSAFLRNPGGPRCGWSPLVTHRPQRHAL